MGSAVQVIHMEGVKRVIVPIFLIFITLSLFLLLKPSESIKDNSTKQQDERKSPADVQDCNAKAFTAIKLLNMTQSFMVCGADAIFSEHVWEHLTPMQALAAAASAFPWLKPGGRWRIAVPDAFFRHDAYQLYSRAGVFNVVQPHSIVWSKDSLSELLQYVGFEVKLLEYYSLNGNFFSEEYDEAEYGKVKRTHKNDRRNHGNKDPPGAMTSLVVDAIKPLNCPVAVCH